MTGLLPGNYWSLFNLVFDSKLCLGQLGSGHWDLGIALRFHVLYSAMPSLVFGFGIWSHSLEQNVCVMRSSTELLILHCLFFQSIFKSNYIVLLFTVIINLLSVTLMVWLVCWCYVYTQLGCISQEIDTWWWWWCWWCSMKNQYDYHILVITTAPIYPFINMMIQVRFTEKIKPLSENSKAYFERHSFLHLTCHHRLPSNKAENQSASKTKHTSSKMYTRCNSNGTFMPIQKQLCTYYCGCLWCCC